MMSRVNQITSPSSLRLQHAQAGLPAGGSTDNHVQFAELLRQEVNKPSSVQFSIVNVPNNVVITTMSGAEMKDNIFTNIDSAVLI